VVQKTQILYLQNGRVNECCGLVKATADYIVCLNKVGVNNINVDRMVSSQACEYVQYYRGGAENLPNLLTTWMGSIFLVFLWLGMNIS
jgi:hypothetical protein